MSKAAAMLPARGRKGPAALALATGAAGLFAAKRRRSSAANEPLEPNLPAGHQHAETPPATTPAEQEQERSQTA